MNKAYHGVDVTTKSYAPVTLTKISATLAFNGPPNVIAEAARRAGFSTTVVMGLEQSVNLHLSHVQGDELINKLAQFFDDAPRQLPHERQDSDI